MAEGTLGVELHVVVPALTGSPDGDITVVKGIDVDAPNWAALMTMVQFVGARFGGEVVEVGE